MTTHQAINTYKQKQSVGTSFQIALCHERIRGYQSGILVESYFCLSENTFSHIHFQLEIERRFRTHGENFLLTFSCEFETDPTFWQTQRSKSHDLQSHIQSHQVGTHLGCMR